MGSRSAVGRRPHAEVEPPASVAGYSAGYTVEELTAALDAMEVALVDDFRQIAGPAERAERTALELGRMDLHMRARLIGGDVLGRSGDVAEAGRIAQAVNLWAKENGDRYLLARSHRQLAIFFRRVGDGAEALVHAVQCVQHTDDDVLPALRAGHLVTLALVLDINGSFEEARERFTEALRIAEDIADPGLMLRILNNMAFTAYESGDEPTASRLVNRIREIEAAYGIPLDALYLDTIARVQLMQGRYLEAQHTLLPVVNDPTGPIVNESDALPECLLTRTEAQRLAGDLAGAQASLDWARELCEERGLAGVAARVREAQAELHAAAGDFRAAYAEHRRFHADAQALNSAQRDARARAVHAVFETEQARRASERFRELSLRDPLTGLYNRRYVDERLPGLVAEAAERGGCLSLALLDLDHFKRVNDTLSHEVGDEVLRRLAGVLTTTLPAPAIPTRLGGEEFLLVLPGADRTTAIGLCEAVRTALHDQDWRPLTGDLPITASLGVTTVAGGLVRPAALLAEADRNLYTAKRSGRDRVIATPRP